MYFISLNEWLIEADEALLAGTGVPDWASVGLPNGPCLHLWELLSTRYPPESGRESWAEMDLPFDWKAQQSRSSKIRCKVKHSCFLLSSRIATGGKMVHHISVLKVNYPRRHNTSFLGRKHKAIHSI